MFGGPQRRNRRVELTKIHEHLRHMVTFHPIGTAEVPIDSGPLEGRSGQILRGGRYLPNGYRYGARTDICWSWHLTADFGTTSGTPQAVVLRTGSYGGQKRWSDRVK